jgi:lipoyl-dependent peroxiredoxin subunit D
MEQIEKLLERLPESCKDLRLNMTSVLRGTGLTGTQTWSIALTSAFFCKNSRLAEAVKNDGTAHLSPADIDDAQGVAAIMGMNTAYYRFRHLIEIPEYQSLKANLRMNRMMNPATSKLQFEVCAMACAVLAGCQMCMQAHEKALIEQGLTQSQIHDAVRIASIVAGVDIALNLSAAASTT